MQINRPQMLSRVDYKPIRGAVPRNQNPQERWWSAVHKSWSDQTIVYYILYIVYIVYSILYIVSCSS